MRNFFKSPFGSEAKTDYVQAFLERSNMEILVHVTSALLMLYAICLMSTFLPLAVWTQRSEFMVWLYRAFFVALIALNAIFGMLSNSYFEKRSVRVGRGRTYLAWYFVLMLALNLWITITDFAHMGRYFFLLVTMFLLYSLFFIRPHLALLCDAAVGTITLMGLGFLGMLTSLQVIILLAYVTVIQVVSMVNYAARVRVAITDERLLDSSRHDELTKVLNRRAFNEDAVSFVGHPAFLALADVDELKYFNDLHGHATGDALLQDFAQDMVEAFGAGRVYRYGGDEFIAVFPDDDEDELHGRIDVLYERFSARKVGTDNVGPTCSVGCVYGTAKDEGQVYDLVRIAEMLLNRSKENGRDRMTYAHYSDGLLREAIEDTAARTMTEDSVDTLTGLMNRHDFLARASDVAPVLLAKRQSISFVYFNVANLKDYNARYSFKEGDELLKYVARTLEEVFPNRPLSRFGDDRFVLMTEEKGLAEAIERACELVREHQPERLYALRAGVFRYVSANVEIHYACDCARLACESLRGYYDVRYRYYTEKLGADMTRRNRVLERFGKALEQGYIQPYYQPIVRTASDMVCDCEILARWIDPEEGVLSPADFIPALEDARLITRLDLYIVEQVCKNFRRALREGAELCPVSVNFSRIDFESCDLVKEVTTMLDRYDIPREMLCVEVTESVLGEDSDRLRQALTRFRQEGLQVWMDDFGSGYSALNVLREYDFDLVKFDMSFLKGVEGDIEHSASGIMLINLVSMVKELGLQTLIEGVEDIEQLTYLRKISFEKIQGFVFARPMPFGQLCSEIAQKRLVVEEPKKRAYFDLVSKVNLVQPVEPGSTFDPTGVADGVPVCVLEHTKGELHYLEHNAAYEKRLGSMGIGSATELENMLNAREGIIAQSVWEVIPLLARSDAWVTIDHQHGDVAPCYARCVARVPYSETFALVLCAAPVGR